LGTRESAPGQQHLYVAPDPGLSAASNNLGSPMETRRLEPRCLTCRLERQYENCTFFSALLSPDTGYVVLECLGPGTPVAGLHEPLASLNGKFKLIRMLAEGFHQKITITGTSLIALLYFLRSFFCILKQL